MFKFFDAHLHIIDPDFPLQMNQGYLPPPFTVQDYRDRTAPFQVKGGAIVSGSFQGFDQTYLLDALRRLGPNFVGVTQLPATVTDAEITALNERGVRAVRFNIKRGGSAALEQLPALAARVHQLAGWHVELYIEAKDLPDLAPTLATLPAVSIDHLGLTKAGFTTLLSLAEKGLRVKATGFARTELNVARALKDIYAANPQALMFGTDLPSTRAPRPFTAADLHLLAEALPGDQALADVLYRNALSWYRGA